MVTQKAGRAPRLGARVPLFLLLSVVVVLGGAAGLVALMAPETPPGEAPKRVSLALERIPLPADTKASETAPTPPAEAPPAEAPPEVAQPVEPPPARPQLDDRQLEPLPPGKRPREAYAGSFRLSDPRPRIAVILTGLGLSGAATETAIKSLPASITLAFMPYADNLNGWVRLARAAGHEVLLSLPMEPVNYPAFDPGPRALLTSLTAEQNIARLDWALGRTRGYVGVIDFMGSYFTTSERHLKPVLEAINARGLLFVDSRTAVRSAAGEVARAIGLPFAASAQLLDDQASRASIDARLGQLEQVARQSGRSVGVGSLYPVTLERIAAWAETVERRGVALAPVSAVAAMMRGSDG